MLKTINLPFWVEVFQRRLRIITIAFVIGCFYFIDVPKISERRYEIETRYILGYDPLESTLVDEEQKYFNWLTSEYVTASMSIWVEGTRFSDMVALRMQERGYEDMDSLAVDDDMSTSHLRSTLVTIVVADTEQMAIDFAEVVDEVLIDTQDEIGIPQFSGSSPPIVTAIDGEVFVDDYGSKGKFASGIPYQLFYAAFWALVAGALFDRVDPTIRRKGELKSLKFNILAEIPQG